MKKVIQVGGLTGVSDFTTFCFSMPYLAVPGLGLQLRVSKAGFILKQDIMAISWNLSGRIPQGLMEWITPSPPLN